MSTAPSSATRPHSRHRVRPLRLRLAAVAFATTAGMVSSAHAVVVTFSTPIVVPSTFDGIYVNLATGATGATSAATPGWDFDPYNSGASLSFFFPAMPVSSQGGVAGSTTGPYLDLAPGAVVSNTSTYTAVTATAATAAFRTVGTHVLGFRFFNETTSAINYGAATLSVGGTTGFPLTIASWSYENSGGPYTVPDDFGSGFVDGFED